MQTMTTPSVIWQRTKLALATVLMAMFGLTGFVSADSTITNTGPRSTNKISNTSRADCMVHNTNTLRVDNNNHQTARTGNAKASGNTTAGDATTGDASNANAVAVEGNIDNSQAAEACACAAAAPSQEAAAEISTTGPSSSNIITDTATTTTTVTNTTNVSVNNSNDQVANTGNATVSGNTTAGDATTGDASNHNAADFMLNLINGAPASMPAHTSTVGADCETADSPTPGSGSMGGGSSAPIAHTSSFTNAPRPFGGRGGGSASAGGSSFFSPRFVQSSSSNASPSVYTVSAPAPVVHPMVTPVGGGMGGSTPVPEATAPSSSSIGNTGPGSNNTISNTATNTTTVTNTNNVSAYNTNYQTANSNNAAVTNNTTAGSATTGVANNSNTTGVGAAIAN